MNRILLSGLAAGLSLLVASVAGADVILSNLPANPSTTGTNLGLGSDGADRTKGVGATMGDVDLIFDDMTVLMSNENGPNTPTTLSGGIFSNAAGTFNQPDTKLVDFVPVAVPAGASPYLVTLETDTTFTLEADTTYWFVLEGPDTLNYLRWQLVSPQMTPTVTGVTYRGYRFSSNGGTTWVSSSSTNGISISASPVPEPALASLGVVGLLALRRRR